MSRATYTSMDTLVRRGQQIKCYNQFVLECHKPEQNYVVVKTISLAEKQSMSEHRKRKQEEEQRDHERQLESFKKQKCLVPQKDRKAETNLKHEEIQEHQQEEEGEANEEGEEEDEEEEPSSFLLETKRLKALKRRFNKKKKQDKYSGAIVIDAIQEFHSDVAIAILDFNSLYPSTLIAHNLCYASLIRSPELLDFCEQHHIPVEKCDTGKNGTCTFVQHLDPPPPSGLTCLRLTFFQCLCRNGYWRIAKSGRRP